MAIFELPDLGEGLPDAEIHEWYVKIGDLVEVDQPLVLMETAKAIVDVPSPTSGKVSKLFGAPGDIIKTGEPLISFAEDNLEHTATDKGTVVGNLEESNEISIDNFTIGSVDKNIIKATPSVRLLAKKLGVDLQTVIGSGEHGVITRQDIETIANKLADKIKNTIPNGYQQLRGVRKTM